MSKQWQKPLIAVQDIIALSLKGADPALVRRRTSNPARWHQLLPLELSDLLPRRSVGLTLDKAHVAALSQGICLRGFTHEGNCFS